MLVAPPLSLSENSAGTAEWRLPGPPKPPPALPKPLPATGLCANPNNLIWPHPPETLHVQPSPQPRLIHFSSQICHLYRRNFHARSWLRHRKGARQGWSSSRNETVLAKLNMETANEGNFGRDVNRLVSRLPQPRAFAALVRCRQIAG